MKENENVDWYEPKIAKCNFICQTEKWLKRQQDPQSLVDVHDSVSIVSKSSSKASSVHSALIKIAVDEAGLLARAKSLREKHKMEKVRLHAKMEALQLREDLAVTNAKLQALKEIDPTE